MTNYFWDFVVFVFLVSGPTLVPSALSSSSALLTASYLIFFSLPLPMRVAAPIASITPLLIGTPEKVPTIRSHPNQASRKLFAYHTQPPLAACHSATLVLLLIATKTMPAVGRARHLLKVGVEKRPESRTLAILPEPTKFENYF